MKREIMINDGHDIEVVPSSCIIQAMLRLERGQADLPATITVGRIPEPTTVGVRGVYEKYVHLDQCLSDRAWLGESILSQILFDLWQAIREEEEWKKEKKG